ncbi:MAG: hypothetical protein U9O20_02705 [Patescibacteria group bacterium]|nr:hypothetical protein [Patescibacteria group bacterium]
MKGKIKILIFLLLVAGFIYRYFFYIDLQYACFVRINPSVTELSNANIKRAIKVLKHGAPEDYRTFCSTVEVIDPNPSCGGFGGGCFHPAKGRKSTIDISTSQRDLAWTAAIIMHETCHAIQYREHRALDEDECYEVDDRTIKQLMQL